MKTEALPRVGVVDAVSTGLTLAARRPWLLLLPLVSELLLWLAPPVSIQALIQRFLAVWEALLRATYSPGQLANLDEMVSTVREAGTQLGNSFNLAEALTGGWLGAPSAFSLAQVTRMTFISDLVLAPTGIALYSQHMSPAAWRAAPIEVPSLPMLLLGLVSLWLAGQLLTTLYLRWVGLSWRGRKYAATGQGVRGFLKLAARLAVYSILLGAAILILRLPLAIALALLWMSSSSALGLLMLLFSGVALWLTLWFLASLFFVNEAILLDRQPVWRGVLQSIVLVHNNFWPTMGLCLLINLLMYGFRIIWEIMGHTPVGAGLAIIGNAYLATGLLLAVFVFYDGLARRTVARRLVPGKRES